MGRNRKALLAALALLTAAVMGSPGSAAGAALRVAVADFDYSDTSGEPRDQAAEHAARVGAFAGILRQSLAEGGYSVVPLGCPESACSVGSLGPDALVAAARKAGARFLVYGGIHKMSTLIQWGKVQAVDLERDKLVLDRSITFRGDTDEAFRRAAGFVVQELEAAVPKP
ncbi:Protein of unknown function [Tistlia consotensis]|uniref:DUF2380 domain-containing protein n=1 Tax=Tistlia consotensis USBA 355 TaxID=560819 RepID=A0A1Y6BR75_9PROT|nr:DUF2380 domain-containing protein [Tistlia consotensis]SMF16779.1 Protein of unknown function [Tistlia consotensis USBA 355]SNR40927.1 Protein of unknown function [Tistlia consotensis]